MGLGQLQNNDNNNNVVCGTYFNRWKKQKKMDKKVFKGFQGSSRVIGRARRIEFDSPAK